MQRQGVISSWCDRRPIIWGASFLFVGPTTTAPMFQSSVLLSHSISLTRPCRPIVPPRISTSLPPLSPFPSCAARLVVSRTTSGSAWCAGTSAADVTRGSTQTGTSASPATRTGVVCEGRRGSLFFYPPVHALQTRVLLVCAKYFVRRRLSLSLFVFLSMWLQPFPAGVLFIAPLFQRVGSF